MLKDNFYEDFWVRAQKILFEDTVHSLTYFCNTDLITTIIGPDLANLGKRLNSGFKVGIFIVGGLLKISVVAVTASTSSLCIPRN